MTVATSRAQRAPGRTPLAGMSFGSAVRLIAEREVRTYLRLKGFWISFGIPLVVMFALAILPSLFDGPTEVAAVGPEAARVLTGTDLEVRTVADVAAAEALVRSDEVAAAVVPDTTGGVRVIALTDPPTGVLAILTTAPPVDLLDASAVSEGERQVVVTIFGIVFLLFGMGGMAIAQGTVTEKQTRIVEILVATIPVRALLAGKIAGHTLLTLGQVAVFALAAPVALSLGGQSELLAVVAPALGWFVPFLIVGVMFLAALWAVTGALVSRLEDLSSSPGPMMVILLGPYFGVLFFAENPTVLAVLSYLPISAAMAMPIRLFTDDAQIWEPILALGLLAGTVVVTVLLASRLFSGSLLQTRGKVSLAQAWAHAD